MLADDSGMIRQAQLAVVAAVRAPVLRIQAMGSAHLDVLSDAPTLGSRHRYATVMTTGPLLTSLSA